MKPVKIPIEDVLDLHTFKPKEIPDLLSDYLGRGILKDRVRRLLKKNPMVASFSNAPLEAGGWGATLVELRHK